MDPVWFDILIVSLVEIGLITPPVGMDLFVVQALVPHVGQKAIIRGNGPFIAADVNRVALLATIPMISLLLPKMLGF